MKKMKLCTLAILAASTLMLTSCGSGNAEAVTTAAATTAEETATAAEESTTAAEETTTAAEETTAAAEESTAATEESTTEKESSEAAKDEKDASAASEKAEAKASEAPATTAAETKAAATGAAPSDIYSKVTSYLPSMVNFDANYISNYYGIDASQLDGYVFAAAEDVTQADTVVILKAKDASQVSTLSSQLATVKQQKEAELQDYNPTAYQVAAAGYVKTSGNYVYLIMSSNASAIDQVISANVG
ncbi:MAG TPA: hypothetical protein DIW34_05740 [Oribacterium sp.]|nr:hypothetical protein [Oribacterium sp.]